MFQHTLVKNLFGGVLTNNVVSLVSYSNIQLKFHLFIQTKNSVLNTQDLYFYTHDQSFLMYSSCYFTDSKDVSVINFTLINAKIMIGFKVLTVYPLLLFFACHKICETGENVYMYQFLFASVIFCDLKSF